MHNHNTYKTSEVAKITGIHPNTVRLYEQWELIPKAERKPNGYRIFTDFHIEQIRLIQIALQIPILQNGLRETAFEIIISSSVGNFNEAEVIAKQYSNMIKSEQEKAEEAIEIVKQLLSDEKYQINEFTLTRKQTAEYLKITTDTLRNWELNGLLKIKRRENGYRVYTDQDIKRLKIIRTLKTANYSLSSILRLLGELSRDPKSDIKKVMDTPHETEDIISVCDKLITSLKAAEVNAEKILVKLNDMKKLVGYK